MVKKRGKKVIKKITTIYLEESLIEKARENGLNISKVCEIALARRIVLLSSLEGREKVRR